MGMVEFGGPIVKAYPFNVQQNIICLIVGGMELIVGLVIKMLPLGWF
jgi:hypothetical protein